MSNAVISYAALAQAMKTKCGNRPQRECAAEVGISESTFSRLANMKTNSVCGRPAQVETATVYAVCKWLGHPVETYTERGVPPQSGTPDAIEWHLLRDPRLSQEDAIRLSNMIRAAYDVVARKSETKP